jgi:hypothetical protein
MVAKLNDVEPLAWLTDVLERVVSGRTKNVNWTGGQVRRGQDRVTRRLHATSVNNDDPPH